MQDTLQEAVSFGKARGASFVELRHQDIEKNTIVLRNGAGKVISGREEGVAIRALAGGAWGFLSVASSDLETIKKGVADAVALANATKGKLKEAVELAEMKSIEATVEMSFDVDPREVTPSDKFDMLLGMHKTISGHDPRIKSTDITYVDTVKRQHYRNSDDIIVTSDKCMCYSRVRAGGQELSVRVGGGEEFGSPHGYEVFSGTKVEDIGLMVAKRVVANLGAKQGKGGEYPAVLGPSVAGVLAHEACGHLFEADLTEQSAVGTVLGENVGSEFATIIDDGSYAGALGSSQYDDEGTPTGETVFLDKGRVAALLTDREYSQKFARIIAEKGVDVVHSPSGNARAFDYRVPPIIRMTNTYFECGDHSWEELLEPIEFGYYMVRFRGGQAQTSGSFTVGIDQAYEIVNGELGDPVRGVSISGNTLDTLKGISAVGRPDSMTLTPGRCGKGQVAVITSGSANLRIDAVTVSGQSKEEMT